MATLAEIADKNVNCGGASADTGTLGCQIEFGTPLHAIGVRKGTVIPKDTEFNKAYIDEQVQKGVFIPMIGADSFEETSSEDSYNTNSRGINKLSVLGLPEYNFTYQLGHEFYKEISRLTSFKALDFIYGDENGNWKLAVNSDGDFTGYECGQVTAMMTKTKIQGGDPESKTIRIQMLNRTEWDRDYAILERELLTFSPEEIDGINGVEIAVDPVGDSDTEIVVNIKLAADRSTPVSGLATDQLDVKVDGSTVSSTWAEDPNIAGKYTGTVSAVTAGQTVQVSTMDSTLNVYAITVAGAIYRGHSAVETVSV